MLSTGRDSFFSGCSLMRSQRKQSPWPSRLRSAPMVEFQVRFRIQFVGSWVFSQSNNEFEQVKDVKDVKINWVDCFCNCHGLFDSWRDRALLRTSFAKRRNWRNWIHKVFRHSNGSSTWSGHPMKKDCCRCCSCFSCFSFSSLLIVFVSSNPWCQYRISKTCFSMSYISCSPLLFELGGWPEDFTPSKCVCRWCLKTFGGKIPWSTFQSFLQFCKKDSEELEATALLHRAFCSVDQCSSPSLSLTLCFSYILYLFIFI